MPTPRIDLTGQVFGRLTVLEEVEPIGPPGGRRRIRWRCVCECGNENLVTSRSLRAGGARSCGCLQREQLSARSRAAAGENSPCWKGDQVAYGPAHTRLRKQHGSARERTCVDCGGPAEEWSYDGGCPNEQTGVDKGHVIQYCPALPDHECYVPRCVPCHRTYDRRKEAA